VPDVFTIYQKHHVLGQIGAMIGYTFEHLGHRLYLKGALDELFAALHYADQFHQHVAI